MSRKSLAATTLVAAVTLGLMSAATAASAAPTAAPAVAAVTAGSVTPPVTAPAPPTFPDVKPDSAFGADVSWLAQSGITTGYGDGTFKPSRLVDRAAMIAFVYRLSHPGVADPTCTEAPFRDVPADHQFCGVISWAKDAGVTNGYAGNLFKPALEVSRSAAVAFLHRASGDTAEACTEAPFTDVPATNEFCAAITWAKGKGITTGYEDGSFHPAEGVTRQAMAAFLHRFDDLLLIPAEANGVAGALGIGDVLYPEAGNGGYDVASYHLDLTYNPATKRLDSAATIVATVTQGERLGSFSLDLEMRMTVSSVKVNNRAASFVHSNRELVVTPKGGLTDGSVFEVVVEYGGQPGYVPDIYGDSGWHDLGSFRSNPGTQGAAVVAGEPASQSAWYPANAHPLDKALFSVNATVPSDWSVIANGLPVTEGLPAAPTGWTTYGWAAAEEMAGYLNTFYVDKFTTDTTVTDDGVTIINAYAPGVTQTIKDRAGRTEEIMDWLSAKVGPYPFNASGGIYLNTSIGYALETQTRSVYSRNASLSTIVHEIAHQWFGDNVTIKRWGDICLNECFASYSEWMWNEEKSGSNLDTTYRNNLNSNIGRANFWARPLVGMQAGQEFDDAYTRGAMALHALRREVGDTAFRTAMYRLANDFAGGHADWSDWEDLVEQVAGRDLTPFFNAWFHSTGVPATQFLYPGSLGNS